MKSKTRRIKTGFLSLFAICLLAISLFIVAPKNGVTVHAATSSSNVCTVKGQFESLAGIPQSLDATNNFTVTMESLNASGTGTLESNVILNWSYVKIKVNVKSVSEHKSFTLERDGENYYSNTLSGNSSMTFYSGNLPDGNYRMLYYLSMKVGNAYYAGLFYVFRFSIDTTAPITTFTANGSPLTSGSYTNKSITYSASDTNFKYIYYKKPSASSFSTTTNDSYFVEATSANSGWWEFYSTDSLGNASDKVKAYLDCVAPTMSCSSGVSFGGTTGKAFTITATDAAGAAKLYVKYESEEWFTNGSKYTVPATERSGRYYFYAEDDYGNKTDTKWVVLSTDEPVGRMVKSDTDNSVSFTWDSDYWSAKLDGKTYNKGTWIAAEGNHTMVLSNNAEKTKTYNFSIDHYYVQTSITEATCKANGSVKYECLQCGDVKNEAVYSKGHQYRVETIPASCVSQGENIYTCTVCGDTRREASGLPEGHSFTSRIIQAATCTQDGVRQNVCDLCGTVTESRIAAQGHSYEITDVRTTNGNTTRSYTCSTCGDRYTQELGNQYEEVSSYVEYLFEQYSPYMIWVFLATAGVWSIAIGVALIIAHKNEDKEKAKKMLINYVIGLVVIFAILVACPYLVRGIAVLVT